MDLLLVSYHFLSKNFRVGLLLLVINFFIGTDWLITVLSLFSVRKRRGGNKQGDGGATAGRDPSQPVKTGSPQFVRELRSRTFPK